MIGTTKLPMIPIIFKPSIGEKKASTTSTTANINQNNMSIVSMRSSCLICSLISIFHILSCCYYPTISARIVPQLLTHYSSIINMHSKVIVLVLHQGILVFLPVFLKELLNIFTRKAFFNVLHIFKLLTVNSTDSVFTFIV